MIDVNKKLLNKALQLGHRGQRAGYERLEFLGDRVVGLVVAELLYTAFPDEEEGALAKRFVALTREEALAQIAEQIGLPALLKTTEDKMRHNTSILGDVCEAVLGAMYLDKGLDAVKAFMIPLWQPLIEATPVIPQDSKSALQEWSQKTYKILPKYVSLGRTGPDHHPSFTVRVEVGQHMATGIGSSKKMAEQAAADTLLKEVQNGSE